MTETTAVPGRSTATLKDVAARAGVSTAAVSQALNGRGNLREDTRRRILASADELGYAPNRTASALRSGRAMSIGYLVDDMVDEIAEGRWAVTALRQLNALVRSAAAQGFTITALPAERPDLVGQSHVDAVYAPDASPDDPILRDALQRGRTVVTNDLALDVPGTLAIVTGYEEATRAGLDVLAASGARRIGLLTESPGRPRYEIGERIYRDWCAEQGRAPVVVRGDTAHAAAEFCVRQLLDAGVDAIFSYYQDGPEIYLLLERHRVVLPRDLQLVTLCTHECALNERLGVTRVCVHPESAPPLMMPTLARLIVSGEPVSATLRLPWELARGSTTR